MRASSFLVRSFPALVSSQANPSLELFLLQLLSRRPRTYWGQFPLSETERTRRRKAPSRLRDVARQIDDSCRYKEERSDLGRALTAVRLPATVRYPRRSRLPSWSRWCRREYRQSA